MRQTGFIVVIAIVAVVGWGGCAQFWSHQPAICAQPPTTMAELRSGRYDWTNLQETCTYKILRGDLGPFLIGETKEAALRTIEESGTRYVNVVLSSGSLGEFLNVNDDRTALLYHRDAWSADALGSLCPFDPFYSRVALHFEGQHLHRIEHFCLAYELP